MNDKVFVFRINTKAQTLTYTLSFIVIHCITSFTTIDACRRTEFLSILSASYDLPVPHTLHIQC